MKKLFLLCLLTSNFLLLNAQSKIIAKEYAYDAAVRLMRSISPNTGKSATAYIRDVEYDYSSDQYIIEMEASWTAGVCGYCANESFSVSGILKVDKNGYSPYFKELSRNDAVRRAWTDGQVGAIFITVAALSSNTNRSPNNN